MNLSRVNVGGAAARMLGTRNVAGGKGRQRIASLSLPEPRAVTIYTECSPGPVPGTDRGAVGDFRDHRIKLFLQFGSGGGGAFSATGEVPANKPFSVVGQDFTIFGEVWSQYPVNATQPDSSILFTTDPLQTVDCNVGIFEGAPAVAAPPTIWIPSPINRLSAHAFYGQALSPTGLISSLPCVVHSIVGFNGGPSARFFHVMGPATRDRYPEAVIPVAAGDVFSLDYTAGGGRPFPTGASWATSASPNLSTTGDSVLDSAFHVECEVSFL